MSAPPRLELVIPTRPAPQERNGNFSSEGQPLAESPTPTLVPSTPSSVDTVLTKFPEPANVIDEPVEPNLSTLHLLVIHIGLGTFLLLLSSY